MEGVLVRHKDGIVKNVCISGADNTFKRNQDTFTSIAHCTGQNGDVLHGCEMQNAMEKFSLMLRILPGPFSLPIFFGDVLFVLTNSDGAIKNFGINDFRFFIDNTHERLSPGFIIPENTYAIERRDSLALEDDDIDDEEATTQENTTLGTFVTNESSEEEVEEDEETLLQHDKIEDTE